MNAYDKIYQCVKRVPEGKVATCGQIAKLTATSARQVGYALAALPGDTDAPWHRIINSQGRISLRPGGEGHQLQQILLEVEGIIFSQDGKIDLATRRWIDDDY